MTPETIFAYVGVFISSMFFAAWVEDTLLNITGTPDTGGFLGRSIGFGVSAVVLTVSIKLLTQ